MDAIDTIHAKLMSGFGLSYRGEAINLGEDANSKMAQLLAALICYEDKGVESSRMLEMLYYDEEDRSEADVEELALRLRLRLAQSVLPEGEYIVQKDGNYHFGGEIPIESDVEAFCSMYKLADECDEEERFAGFLASCCALYGGELLPLWSERRWVVYENAKLVDMYADSARQLCVYYQRSQEYEKLAGVCERASMFFPFDEEWHVNRINALTAMGDYRRALDEYESVTSMLFDEMGVYPSEKLMDCVRVISGRNVFAIPGDEELPTMLNDTASAGAYYCNYPAFIDGYRVMKRIMDRDGIPSCLLLCTMTDKNGDPIEDHARLAPTAQMLRYALSRTLRKSDMYTRYSASQILVMLWGTPPENTGLIETRIEALLDAQRQEAIDAYVQFAVLDGDAPYRLQASRPQKKWKKIKERSGT